jgi:hypothetical protein
MVGPNQQENAHFSREMEISLELDTIFFHKRFVSAIKRVEDKINDVKDSAYEELERVFDQCRKYHMKNLLGDFNVKVSRDHIFKLSSGSENLHKINNDNGVGVVIFAILHFYNNNDIGTLEYLMDK